MNPDQLIGLSLDVANAHGRDGIPHKFTVVAITRNGEECEVPKDAWRGLVYYVDLVDGVIQQVH